ncbi:DUF3500 domain-containing protein [Terriglobus albidus]|uniref:DUF3500 domain-containing protein n=1 Tax=Terriglobus albidus TaxID=1592106 RepID=A0A5B9EFQ2_9BACT|nr:DUF3500 domain-containing protein [Terriglobus albidus]QEE29600.1 DUF3500 domain-containing protein [Terriglobus albidus]
MLLPSSICHTSRTLTVLLLSFTVALGVVGCGSGGGTAGTSGSTTTTLTSSATSAISGTSITLTAAVSPSGATGTVTFYDGSTSIGTGTLSSGATNISTSSLSVGTHTITATYGGNSSYSGSTSSSVSITITSGSTTSTTTTLSTSLTSVTYGSAVTFTATVSPSAATGSVTFYDGSTSLGAVTLSSGSASLSTSTLTVGTHTITATYAGSSTYSSSTSSAVTVVVNSSSSSSCSNYTGTPLIVCLAQEFYATLSSTQQSTMQLSYTEANAIIWSNLPTAQVSRNGVKIADLSSTQVTALKTLLAAVLSSEGYTREENLRVADDYLASNGGGTSSYGAGRYFIAFLGTPSTTSAWQLQFGGHHYALNVTYNGNYVSATPFFLGVEPPTFTSSGTTIQVMEKQRAAAYALGQTLTSNSSAKLSGTFDDVVHGANGSTSHDDNYPQAYPTSGRGVLYSSLSSTQQALVKSFIEAWVNDQNSDIASTLLSTYEDSTALASTYVGYSGTGAFTTQGDYIRVDGPRVWIEFVVQNGIVFSSSIHYHSIWRDKSADYGGDF